jgi:nucleoside-diphosphate-sugar epimerase
VADLLLACGHEVAVVDDLSSGRRQNVPETARCYQIDIRTGCAEGFADFGPEALSHQAAQMDVRRSVREPDFDAEVNLLGTVWLLENCVFPNRQACLRLVTALALEQSEEWVTGRRYLQMGELNEHRRERAQAVGVVLMER